MSILGGARPGMSKCQHCYQSITMLANGSWVDTDGFFYCVKYTGPLPGTAETTLRHTPLPVIR